jgi:hypothetical protein
VVNDSTPYKTRQTTWLYQLKDSAVVQTEFASRCGGKVIKSYQLNWPNADILIDMKMRMCLIAGIIILLIVIIVPAGT